MRALLQLYRALAAVCHRDNEITEESTADITAIPA